MDKKKAKEFVAELYKLQEKYGIQLAANYEEEIGYDFEDNPCVDGITAHLVLVDKEGFELSLDNLLNEHYTCYYCGRNIEGDGDFCNEGCESKYNKREKE